jgi:hypothetical protein
MNASEVCLCFYQEKHEGSYFVFKATNVMSFFIINFIFSLTLVCMLFKTDKIKNELKIIDEIRLIIIIWIFFCGIQYFCFILQDFSLCCNELETSIECEGFRGFLASIGRNATDFSYFTIIIRDTTASFLTFYYTLKQKRKELERALAF